ncbi:hypothetical protein TanjilG_32591 [Lupinus angustifolius]|uniref:Wound-induced protein 1 n=1 Tax=Lupinus angustifolius TaxID=3871 RepID=A0A4P1R8Z3_LUPAN|nr:PREDICTED: wound-induced protein 1-like [Lupinus angustifolius]OIW04399.1 hypothetical protein TanjilG_32591 [Lupinus angustifolius]
MHRLLAPDLEWRFHGPSCHRHHLVQFLTGSSSSPPSKPCLVPDIIVGFGLVVIAEGYDEENMVWWVHAWTATADGVITEVREYLNTSVTVTKVGDVVAANSKCQTIWQSKLSNDSVPGLILPI